MTFPTGGTLSFNTDGQVIGHVSLDDETKSVSTVR